MYSFVHHHDITWSEFFRDCAAAAATIFAGSWLGLLASEVFRTRELVPNVGAFPQAVALAVLLVGCVAGWRHYLIGAALVIAGTAAFFALSYWNVGLMPPLSAMWLAVPGVLYLLAWLAGRRRFGRWHSLGGRFPTIRIHS